MGKTVPLPDKFTDPDQIIDCLLEGSQLSFTPGFIRKHSLISLECANQARKIYHETGGDCSWGFRNVFVKLMKEKIPSYAEDSDQLLALQYTGYNKNEVIRWSMGHALNVSEVFYRLVIEWVIDEETGKPKLDDEGNKIQKSIATMPDSIETIHERITAEKNGDRFYTFHSITNEEFEMFAGYLKEIKDGNVKGFSLK